MPDTLISPEYLFEVSWEVCNKVGGIHTVIATKSFSAIKEYGNNYMAIGPDLVHDTGENPEFIPDPQLFNNWKQHTDKEGIRIKIGRWNIPAQPIAILVDFTSFLQKKDVIFSSLWEENKLDSLSGQWDYVEPALFGYAVGMVIESFVKFNLSTHNRIVAHFHEWMTGTGLLYLKKTLPQVASVFTTHATVLGRALAGDNRPLYSQLENFNVEELIKEYNIISKHSLEKLTAQNADVFTTVSEITDHECTQFLDKQVDIVTPNGFEDSMIPSGNLFTEKRIAARKKLLQVASSLVSEKLPADSHIIATGGRYEFKNKGVDIFLTSLNELRKQKLKRPIIAFILIPTQHYEARRDLMDAMGRNAFISEGSKFLTHYLHDAEYDVILKHLKQFAFTNAKEEKLKIIYVPSYLNGNDGIFNMPYYDILIGCDQTVYPSYYDPWGYTPLESIAFHVPTITTSLAGFGKWIKNECKKPCKGITILERTDTNDSVLAQQIVKTIIELYSLDSTAMEEVRTNAANLAHTVLWSSLIQHINKAYSLALENTFKRQDQYVEIEDRQIEQTHEYIQPLTNTPRWSKIVVRSKLPDELIRLSEISSNIWWTWDDEVQELFETIDPGLWKKSDLNPSILFEQVAYKRLKELSKNAEYIARLNSVYERFQKYMQSASSLSLPKIAYFSMEFGFHDSLKLYSGGLGVLAGDYLKEASDAKVNIVAIGLLYRYGYFTQMLTTQGEQQVYYDYQHFSKIPVTPVKDEKGDFTIVQIMLPGRIMYSRIWKLNVGRLEMYLLDTDFEKNIAEDRMVSHQLYGGDKGNRLKQELLLGVGGIRALEELKIKPDLFHSNEGHSAFIGLERIRNYMLDAQLTFAEAKEIVRSSTLFTTHTPVPAGHDHFEEDLLRLYLGHYPKRLRISWEQFMALGRSNPNDWKEEFNMSYLAAHLAQEINGVSMLHGSVTREMFACLWPGFLPEELHVNYVTNGVHWSTWTSSEWKKLYRQLSDGPFEDNLMNFEIWNKIYEIPDEQIWDIKQQLRSKLIRGVKERFKENWIKRHEDPKQIVAINNTLSDKVLTVVFARRFAAYKRAHLLFKDLDRLEKLVNNEKMPIQFIFAGKAHPADKAGQELIKMIIEVSKRPEFLGKILFLQNYSMNLAKLLVSGSDIWLNTPTRPLEASGTSGEKAVMNGTLHFSVLDGWWVEGYHPEAGWALTNEKTYENQQFQDDLDAEIIYSMFESEILPLFYNRNNKGVPVEWITFIKNSIANVSPKFTTRRMINDYSEKFYNKLYDRSLKIRDNNYEMAKKISSWKKKMESKWEDIEVLEMKLFDKNTEAIDTGIEYSARIVLNLHEIDPEQVGIELVVTENMHDPVNIQRFNLTSHKKGKAVFETTVHHDRSGSFNYGIRIFPVHEFLPHRQDFSLIRWI